MLIVSTRQVTRDGYVMRAGIHVKEAAPDEGPVSPPLLHDTSVPTIDIDIPHAPLQKGVPG